MKSTTHRGRLAEERGEEYLKTLGYQILARNVRNRGGELDRIAWDGSILCFIEIRSRSRMDLGLPQETIQWRKQRKLAKAAQSYLQTRKKAPPVCRFDVLAMFRPSCDSPWEFELIQDAFRPF